MILPYFTSTYTIGRSLFILEEPEEIDESAPISVYSIAKKYELEEVRIIETSFTGFIKAYKTSEKCGIPFRFGLKLRICDDENDKTEESFKSESNVVIWLLNTQGYSDAIKIYSKAATDGFYYIPRLSWRTLRSMWTKNLGLSIPFYSGFIAKNSLKDGSICPDFPIEPVFALESHDHPTDHLIRAFTEEYTKQNNYNTQKTFKCLYYRSGKREDEVSTDLEALQTYRVATSREGGSKNNLSNPGITDMGLDTFSFQEFLRQTGKNSL